MSTSDNPDDYPPEDGFALTVTTNKAQQQPQQQQLQQPQQQQLQQQGLPKCQLPGCSATCFFQNGAYKDYCSFTHAQEHISSLGPTCKYEKCLRPPYRDPSGRVFEYCGKTHADMAAAANANNNSNRCSLPGCNKAAYHDTASGVIHPFCSVNHANAAKKIASNNQPIASAVVPVSNAGASQPVVVPAPFVSGAPANVSLAPSVSAATTVSAVSAAPAPIAVQAPAPAVQGCKYPNCGKPKYVDNNGRKLDFCGKTHAQAFTQIPAVVKSS